nr:Ig-like domain-containing protein [Acinetobacter sp. Marseille-Q1620]
MASIMIYAQKSHKILIKTETNKIKLDQPSIVQIETHKQDIQSMIRSGNDLVITLKNGQKVVIENFFKVYEEMQENDLVISHGQRYELANFDEKGVFNNYTLIDDTPLVQQLPSDFPQISSPQIDDALFSKMDFIKFGLAALAIEGIYLAAFNSDSSNNNNDDTEIEDKTAPATPKAYLSDDGLVVTGEAEPQSTVYIQDADNNIWGTITVDASGKYEIILENALTDGQKVFIYAMDAVGNMSNPTSVQGMKDTIAPDVPIAQASDDGEIVAGTAEVGSIIYVKDADGNILGQGTANKGVFSIVLTEPLAEGQIAYVTAEDSSGNISESTIIEMGKDTTPPDQPKLQINSEGTVVLGMAEANATIQIKDNSGNIIATASVDAAGNFTLDLSEALGETGIYQIIVIDAVGNKSIPLDIEVGMDTIPPDSPTDLTINEDGTVISGTGEANSVITIKNSSNNIIGSATVDADGRFSITVSTAITDGKYGYITSTDQKGNVSDVATIQGNKDTVAPSAPNLPTVTNDQTDPATTISNGGTTDDATPTFKGANAEVGAILTVYDNGKAIAHVTVESDKTWSWTPDTELSIGQHSFTFTLTDAAGNTSSVSQPFVVIIESADLDTRMLDILNLPLIGEDLFTPEVDKISDLLKPYSEISDDLDIEQIIGENESNSEIENPDDANINELDLDVTVPRIDLENLIQPQVQLI